MYYEGNNELYHHGIKGQQWGVRRYQNPDGTLTAEGKARYFDDKRQQKAASALEQGNYKKSNRIIRRSESRAGRADIRAGYTTGQKVLNFLTGGPLGNRSVAAIQELGPDYITSVLTNLVLNSTIGEAFKWLAIDGMDNQQYLRDKKNNR